MGWGKRSKKRSTRTEKTDAAARGSAKGQEGGSGGRTAWKFQAIDADTMKSDKLDAYYEAQQKAGGAVEEGEWPQVLDALRRTLPVTFRVNDSDRAETRRIVERVRAIQAQVNPGMPEENRLSEVAWFPGDGMCWEAKMSKKDLAKNIPSAKPLHDFLVQETERGNISRQEVVSMIPTLFLDVKRHHLVLDCCAAPGSKTTQIMESLAKGSEEEEAAGTGVTGCVVANDLDAKRCDVLVKQTHRLRELYPNLLITNHNAAQFPSPVVVTEEGTHTQRVQFDRILAEVVCSGDG
eukprot:Rhum_TRINITY_DN14161_c3_g1::Rhum_TRINITY_DN14161_c3_g1_i1::g.70251::m.70251